MKHSPKVNMQSFDEMNFPDAMQAVIDGKKVTRLEWGNKEIYLFLDLYLKIMKADGTTSALLVSDGDMLGTDWVIVIHQ